VIVRVGCALSASSTPRSRSRHTRIIAPISNDGTTIDMLFGALDALR